MPTMSLLIGPIASGKSTFARQRASQGALTVNDDAIVLAVHGGDYSLYDERLKPLYVQIETAIINAAALSGRDVVIDRGCRNRVRQSRFATLGRSLGFDVNAVLFDWCSPETHAERRIKSDSRGLPFEKWLKIAKHHESTFQPVTEDELLPTQNINKLINRSN